ncbi:response regulator transcription factor [Treponema phagedenis]|uniref:response regulator transcription factor n=2 Tax=Treponema phagedenis TaxID=162 RepID=UPI0004656307|nr:response regulator transcription factor [Treponema phagedenis]QEK01539.1 response regulator transcription factor [Treponema phagedenis]QEK06626.1 response regulator transcription factor [Treponema phagedenis]
MKSRTKARIFLLEDSDDTSLGIKHYLEKRDFSVFCACAINEAKKNFNTKFDLIILDINLPDGNGQDFFRYAKSLKDIPIIFLTVKNDEKSIVEGLDLGAEDYITKPFRLAVLHSRINAVLRRTSKAELNAKINSVIILNEYELDTEQKRLFKNKAEIELTAQEYNLMKIFMENHNQTLTRLKLLDLVWDSKNNFVNDNTLTATVRRLRQKLDEPLLKTIHGIGYRLEI